jgi:hypothetical protein
MNPKNCPDEGVRVGRFLFIVTSQHYININLKEGPSNKYTPSNQSPPIIIIINIKNKKIKI